MPPVAPALPRSDSKARLLSHLGLDMRNMVHRRIYNLMKLEASEGRKRIIATLDARARTTNQLSNGHTTSYSTSQIDEAVMDQEVLRIYERAQPVTRPLYDLAVDPGNPERPNWIIRWMLWHVFRYRDGRQHSANHRSSSRHSVVENGVASSTPIRHTAPSIQQSTASARAATSDHRYFDPVREKYRD